jgi:hypothetical protein
MDRAAAELFGATSGGAVEAATAELKLLLVVGGFGHAPRTAHALGLICSNALSGAPVTACTIAISAKPNCLLPGAGPSNGTEIFIVLSFSPTRKRGESGRGVNRSIP